MRFIIAAERARGDLWGGPGPEVMPKSLGRRHSMIAQKIKYNGGRDAYHAVDASRRSEELLARPVCTWCSNARSFIGVRYRPRRRTRASDRRTGAARPRWRGWRSSCQWIRAVVAPPGPISVTVRLRGSPGRTWAWARWPVIGDAASLGGGDCDSRDRPVAVVGLVLRPRG